MTETRPLDPVALLLAQLTRIERNIEALPSLLARLDALTESTRQLEAQWRETARELSQRDDAQQRALSEMGLRMSELVAAVAAISNGLQEQKVYAVDMGKRVAALEQRQAVLADFKTQHEDALTRIGRVERQVETAMDAHSKLNLRVRATEERQEGQGFRERLEACVDDFAKIQPDVADAAALVTEFHEWRPWLKGLRWAATLVGVALALAIIAGILWAVAQSGALLP